MISTLFKPNRRWFVPEVVQTSAMDCGPAALKAMLDTRARLRQRGERVGDEGEGLVVGDVPVQHVAEGAGQRVDECEDGDDG